MATFYIEAVENTDIALVMVGAPTIGTVKYGVNDTTCPNTYTVTTASTPISLTAGQKCYWTITSTTTAFATSKYLKFTSTAKINVGGNLSDLIGGESRIPRNYCFANLFDGCANLIDASNLVVVSDLNSKTYCYQYMFRNCSSLTTASTLPATTLTAGCYNGMFQSCTSLTAVPALPATTLASNCYRFMFQSCTSLTATPALPATTFTTSCYANMFYGCTSIKISETQTGDYSIPYRIPSEGNGTEKSGALANMFGSTGGTFTGTPAINTTYYLWKYSSDLTVTYNGNTIISDEVETPCVVSYKGQTLVSIDASTTKTLNCNGKYMEDNVTIGNRTLNCAGKVMASNVVVEVT